MMMKVRDAAQSVPYIVSTYVITLRRKGNFSNYGKDIIDLDTLQIYNNICIICIILPVQNCVFPKGWRVALLLQQKKDLLLFCGGKVWRKLAGYK